LKFYYKVKTLLYEKKTYQYNVADSNVCYAKRKLRATPTSSTTTGSAGPAIAREIILFRPQIGKTDVNFWFGISFCLKRQHSIPEGIVIHFKNSIGN